MNQPNEYTLTADEQAMIQPIIESVENLQRDAQAILRAITRMRGLDGSWNLNGTKLIKVPDPKVQGAPAPVQEIRGLIDPSAQEFVGAENGRNG